MYISIPYMITFDVQKDAANLRSFFLLFFYNFFSPCYQLSKDWELVLLCGFVATI